MTNLSDTDPFPYLVAREERAAAEATCEKSRQAHLDLAQMYLQQSMLTDTTNAPAASTTEEFAKQLYPTERRQMTFAL